MHPRIGRVVCAAAAAVGGVVALGLPASAGSAQSIDDMGWWWRVKSGPLGELPAAPPNTEDGRLMVQGAPDGASAVAALRATLAEGDGNPVLTLDVVENGDSGGATAILLACQAGAPWSGGEGPQKWEAVPLVDCSHSVQGQRSADGTQWVFPMGALQFKDQINVVLVPGEDPTLPDGSNGSVFQLVFEKPTAASIATTSGGAPDDGGDVGFPPYVPPPSDDPVPDFAAPSFGSSGFSPPVQPALPPANQGTSAIAPRVVARTPVPTQPISSDRPAGARALGFLVLLVGAAGSWWYSQQEEPAPRKLGRFAASIPPTTVAVEPQIGGLGRFARERAGAPRRLS